MTIPLLIMLAIVVGVFMLPGWIFIIFFLGLILFHIGNACHLGYLRLRTQLKEFFNGKWGK